MTTENLEKLKYPIGRFPVLQDLSEEKVQEFINDIEELPQKLEDAISGLTDEQLDTPYRAGGWTIRQVVHHLVDSHINSYVRFRLALTEDKPTIKPYYEDRWANLSDAADGSIELSLPLLKALHARWVYLLRRLTQDDLKKSFLHPQTGNSVSLLRNLALYSWHGRHHVAHITSLKERKGW